MYLCISIFIFFNINIIIINIILVDYLITLSKQIYKYMYAELPK